MDIKKEHIRIGLYVAMGIVLLVIVIYAIKAIRKLFGFSKPETVQIQWNPTPYLPDGGAIESFNPEPYLSELRDVLTNWLLDGSVRCRAYKRLMSLTDNQFIAVVNTYYETFGTTLRSDMNDTWQSGCSIFGKQWDEKIYDRMEDLKVIS
ncbi:MAG: hypothetical protein HRU41_40755 [Saprospiraceae bacterium]|nr:hypothetical protein [Saprospiraceae bacterium]